jgi:hypothetical protein
MALALQEIGTDHCGRELPDGVCACIRRDTGALVAFKVRWLQEDDRGRRRQPSRSFSVRKLGSADRALDAASFFVAGAVAASQAGQGIRSSRGRKAPTANAVFDEWLKFHAIQLSPDHAEKMARLWKREIATRAIGQTRLDEISADPSLLVHAQDEMAEEELKPWKRREIWKLFQAVLRWGRRRHPNALTVDISGLIELPKPPPSRLAYAADAIGLERIVEAVLRRPTRDDLLPLRDAALIAAMGFTVAARPSEWRLTATWADVHQETVELQRPHHGATTRAGGLKRGAHVALLLPNARDRLASYRRALEERYGPQPSHALVFQVLGIEGPIWIRPQGSKEPVPLAWTKNAYNQWVRRVWAPARLVASRAPDAPPGLEQMTLYDCRHTAISMALHSTLVVGSLGMNLHPLAGWAGHDIETLQRYYRHLIARYLNKPPIDLALECQRAKTVIENSPFQEAEWTSAQQPAQRRRRARKAAAQKQGGRRGDECVGRDSNQRLLT